MVRTPMTVRQVAEMVGGTVEGDGSVELDGVGAIDSAGPGELTFAEDARRAALLPASGAGAALVGADCESCPMPLIRVENVPSALATVLTHLAGEDDLPAAGVHPSATVAPDAELADGVAVGPGVVIGERAKIAAGCVFRANVSIGADVEVGQETVLHEGVVVRRGCRIGSRVRIGPNSVIGYDGFGYYTTGGVHNLIPHTGNVVIEDDVEIGACSCVDRAKFGCTRIGAGTKIDNLVQVAHNVQVGEGCLLVGQAGIAGSARLGRYVVLGGHVGVRDNVTLSDGVQCAAFSAVASDVPEGQVVLGIPAGPAREKMRAILAVDKLPELLKRVKKLEEKLKAESDRSQRE